MAIFVPGFFDGIALRLASSVIALMDGFFGGFLMVGFFDVLQVK